MSIETHGEAERKLKNLQTNSETAPLLSKLLMLPPPMHAVVHKNWLSDWQNTTEVWSKILFGLLVSTDF